MRTITLSMPLFGFAATALLSISAFGQSIPGRPARAHPKTETRPATKPCTLTPATLPKMAGVQMGSTYDEVLSLHPEIAEDKHFQKRLEENNGAATSIKVLRVFDGPEHEHPVSVSLFFAERILSVIYVESRGLEDFKSINKAVASYSRFLGVGTDQWTIHYGYAASLKCDGFSFHANSHNEEYPGQNSISIHADVKVKR